MKTIHTHFLLFLCSALVASFTACDNSDSVYGNQLKKEKKLIENYIKREGINIIHNRPENDVWGEKDYLELDDYLYYHPVSFGDSTRGELSSGDLINIRYRKYTLTEESDTLSYWTTNDSSSPTEYTYGYSSSNICSGWIQAIQEMKYDGAECKIICPSKLGMSTDATTVTPYGYDLKIQVRWY